MSWCDPSRPPRVIAHRGDHRHHLENTLPAIESAVTEGADLVEVDVQLAADGAVVVVHDGTFARLWGDPRPVGALDTAAVRALGAGDRRVPLLHEALELSRATGIPLVIDQKTPEVAVAALRLVRDMGMLADTLFCGELAGLQHVRHASAAARIVLNAGGLTPPDVRILGTLRPEVYNPEHSTLAPVLLEALHALGFAVSCWTANDRDDVERLLGMGVDAVMSDDLPTLRAAVDSADWRARASRGLAHAGPANGNLATTLPGAAGR